LKVIPVLDVLKGVVVHAVRGEREKYRPIRSVLCPSADPIEVASAFKALGFDELYMADLDAILGEEPDLSLYQRLKDETGLHLMVDAGVNTIELARRIAASASNVIIGTETLNDLNIVREAIKHLGKDRVIVVLDLVRVGTERGVNLRTVMEILERTSVEVITGGGIRRIKDLEELREIGVSAALVATALHKGKMKPEELRLKGFI